MIVFAEPDKFGWFCLFHLQMTPEQIAAMCYPDGDELSLEYRAAYTEILDIKWGEVVAYAEANGVDLRGRARRAS